MVEKAKTSIKIDPNLWKEVKIEAIKRDMLVSELVDEALKEWIKKRQAE